MKILNFPPECHVPPSKMPKIRFFLNFIDETNKTRRAPLFVEDTGTNLV